MSIQSVPNDQPADRARRSPDGPDVLALIQGLQAGTITPKGVSPEDRRVCVEHLLGEGSSNLELSRLFKVALRTITRDREVIYETHAVERDPKLTSQLAGRLMDAAELAMSRIRRAVRAKDCPPQVKVDAEHRIWQILVDLVKSMQSLGYAETAATKIQADLTHRQAEPQDLSVLAAELEQLRVIQEQVRPDDHAMVQQIESAQLQLEHLKAAENVHQLKQNLKPNQESQP